MSTHISRGSGFIMSIHIPRSRPRVALMLAVAITSLFSLGQAANAAQDGLLAGQISATVSQPLMPVTVQAQAMASQPTAAQLAASEAHMAFRDKAWAARTAPGGGGIMAAAAVVPPAPGSQTVAQAVSPNAPSTFALLRNSIASAASPAGYASNIAEPSVAAAGRNVFMTWNWRAAVSQNNGVTWTDVNPYAGFTAPQSFCCDQDTLYDRGRDMILWYRQGVATGAGDNVVKLSRSLDGGLTWVTYTIAPTTLNGLWTGQWFDYPHLALSNNKLYITTNMFNAAGAFQRMLLMKLDLDVIQAAGGLPITSWSSAVGWSWTPVQGATDTMYLGDQINNATGTFRVYTQPENSGVLSFVDKVIPAWTFTNRDGSCPVLGGMNPCLRADQRITDGYVANNGKSTGEIAFFWNVKQGGAFPYPYVEAAKFNESTKAVIGRPLLWNSAGAWHYAAVSPNERGHVGLAVNYFVNTGTPRVYGGMDDDFNLTGWTVAWMGASAGNPSGNSWGDYNRVRPYYPGGTTWAASAYTKNAAGVSEPHLFIFGRGRDTRDFQRWYTK